jgi:hypothetical protein
MIGTTIHTGDEGKVLIHRHDDVEAVLENNKRLQNESQDTKNGWHHIADIPTIFIEKWMNEDGVTYQEMMSPGGFEALVKRKLRSSDWMWLRTTNKRF